MSLSEANPFLTLPENRLALAAVKRLAPRMKRRTVRLVTIVGCPGVGKSHLARELYRSWEQGEPSGKLLLLTASQFAAQLAEASAARTIPQFQHRHRHDVQLLICEDIQALGPRKETQQQLLAAIDDIITRGGLVLLTSTQMPGELRGFSRRLVNRMHGGVCVFMDLPGEKSRRRLIETFLKSRKGRLTPSEIDTLARQSPISPRELSGLVAQLQSEQRLGRRTGKSSAAVETLLSDRFPDRGLSLESIARETAARFGVKLSDLRGPRRSQSLSLARQVAMYLGREAARMNYSEIGRYFNRANHSTVIHACRKISERCPSDPVLSHELQAVLEAAQRAEKRSQS